MKDLKILVLEGGNNEEHEVSLNTGQEVKKSLGNLGIKFDSILVDPKNFKKEISNYDSDYICFNALHGTFGEDGEIQNILDLASFKYTHSNAKSSFIGFNKKLTKENMLGTSIIFPRYISINLKEINKKILTDLFNHYGALILKPIASGSSFGINILKDINSINLFTKNINDNLNIYQNHNEIMIEKYIEGRELTVSVIEENNCSEAIEVTEIISYNSFFDYESKYTTGFSKHILPADIPIKIYDQCKYQAKLAHDQIQCKGISRSDFIYSNDTIFFLEINTQPGLTPISLVPEQLKYRGISFDNLVLNLIECTL